MDERRRRFERMVEGYSGDVYRYAFALCRNEATAEDLVQETFARAWRFLDSLRERGKARAWLFTTVRREHARLYERRRLPVVDDYPLDLVPAGESDTPQVLELRRAVLELPEILREVLVLQVLGGYTGAEIAEMLGIPRATVNTRLFRARQCLHQRLGAAPGQEERRSGRSAAE